MPRKRSKKKTDFNQYLPLLLIGALVVAFVFLGAGPTGKFGATGGILTYTADDCHYPYSLLLSEGSQPPINCCHDQMGDELWCVGDELPREESPPPPPGQECTQLGDCDGDGYTILDGDCMDLDPFINPADNDGDSYSTCDGDCNDNDASLSPADNDGDGWSTCDGDYDDNNALCTDYELSLDNDGDGYNICDRDCNDNDNSVWQYLSGLVDNDGDGYPVGSVQQICSASSLPEGYTSSLVNGKDCDDTDANINSGSTASDFFVNNNYPDYNCNGGVDLPLGTIFVRASGTPVESLSLLSSIDSTCMQAAISNKLTGTWEALINSYSCSTYSEGIHSGCMRDRTIKETISSLPSNKYYNVRGELLADKKFRNSNGALLSQTGSSSGNGFPTGYSLYVAPKYSETGSSNCNPVWTGSDYDGTMLKEVSPWPPSGWVASALQSQIATTGAYSCRMWTDSTSSYTNGQFDAIGSYGSSCDKEKAFNANAIADCGNLYTNYCIRVNTASFIPSEQAP